MIEIFSGKKNTTRGILTLDSDNKNLSLEITDGQHSVKVKLDFAPDGNSFHMTASGDGKLACDPVAMFLELEVVDGKRNDTD